MKCLSEIINFRWKEKRDEVLKNYIEDLGKKICFEIMFKLFNECCFENF